MPGRNFVTLAEVDAFCTTELGTGCHVAEHHMGHYVIGMDEHTYYDSTWPRTVPRVDGAFFAGGQIRNGTRFWVNIIGRIAGISASNPFEACITFSVNSKETWAGSIAATGAASSAQQRL